MVRSVYSRQVAKKAEALVDAHLDRTSRWLRGWVDQYKGRRDFWIVPGSPETQRAALRNGKPPVAHWTAIDGTCCTCHAQRESRSGVCSHMVAAEVLRERAEAERVAARRAEDERRARLAAAALDVEDDAATAVMAAVQWEDDQRRFRRSNGG